MPRKKGDTNDKWWADAIRRAVNVETTDPLTGEKVKRLRRIADSLVTAAEQGDIAAIKEIGDRLDGKPKQATEVSGEGGGPLLLSWLKE
jgi:ribosomal protein L17